MEIENLPWTADVGECAKVRDSQNALIATCHHINGDGCRRDADEVASYARLLSAAPEMYEALKAYEKLDDFHANCPECDGELQPELCEKCFPLADDARLKMRAAIAKATAKS